MRDKPTAILLMGPTASGKTALSVAMAHALNAEIISVDSALVYRGMDIGTAKPSPAERGGIPHHLIDILDPCESFSTGQFKAMAQALMDEIHARGKVPMLVGGTMLYFSALTQGLAKLPEANPEIRQRLDRELTKLGKEALYARLVRVDPQAAARIHINDPQRIQRALEVYEISGRPLSSFFQSDQKPDQKFSFVKLIVAPAQRSTLHEKIAARFRQMLAQGFIDEVQALRSRGDLDETMPSIRCVGYRQAWSYLDGEYDYDQMVEKAIAATRQLAKRQYTWLRKEEGAVHLLSEAPNLLKTVLDHCRSYD
ncbi:MAG: tRNA (adenosine(37)-N6)-dimethylallyltransferase MiaA [Gammaproteobacteria bacterium]